MTRPLAIVGGSCAITLAIVAGIVESALAVAQWDDTVGLSVADGVQIAARAVVYAAGPLVADQLYAGRRWARWALLIMFGMLWLGTLTIPLTPQLVAATDLRSAFGGDARPVFSLLRTIQLVLVPGGLIAMFRPAASAYLMTARSRVWLMPR
ncbi:hypothetical protein GCM10011575_35520 [Microlunatus endophyticus]|uniref:Uncharacterized protein n=1 Tax=Microlunatus endophyticus TaxID=1716077 RepID=A0A917SDG6_9ACTN|nr:hypothetical protein [Microlunatus endophyticus]GGL74191.1 hypothetical protein GCM10011575_35520 [Microlunatus endophyticus]